LRSTAVLEQADAVASCLAEEGVVQTWCDELPCMVVVAAVSEAAWERCALDPGVVARSELSWVPVPGEAEKWKVRSLWLAPSEWSERWSDQLWAERQRARNREAFLDMSRAVADDP
jgi:hypothetical protein